MVRASFRSVVFASLALAFAAPASAQFYSEGFEFLEAVKDRNGTDATEMLNRPGTQIVNARDITSGETGLHIVTARRDLQWVRFLLQEGANPNIADNAGRTPLILAAELGFIEAVEALIRGGARVDVANSTGETPLISAVHARNVDLIEVLVENGADPDVTDNTGRSARDYARMDNVSRRVLTAIESGDNTDDDGEGRTYGPVF